AQGSGARSASKAQGREPAAPARLRVGSPQRQQGSGVGSPQRQQGSGVGSPQRQQGNCSLTFHHVPNSVSQILFIRNDFAISAFGEPVPAARLLRPNFGQASRFR